MAKNLISGTTTTINESGNDIAVDLNQDYKDFIDINESLETTAQTIPKAINEVKNNINYGAILYENDSGTNGNVSLSDSAANYDYIEIYYRTNDNDYAYEKVYQPDGKYVCLFGTRANTSVPRVYGKTKTVYISGNSITNYANGNAQYTINNNANGQVAENNMVYIVRVIGYTRTQIPNEVDSTEPVILYDNTVDGTNGPITLNDSANNYSYIEIFYAWASSFGMSSMRYDMASTYPINLEQIVFNNSKVYWASNRWTVSGTNLSYVEGEFWSIGTSGNATRNVSQTIRIYKVLGYK